MARARVVEAALTDPPFLRKLKALVNLSGKHPAHLSFFNCKIAGNIIHEESR
jgi:hypothetical protein